MMEKLNQKNSRKFSCYLSNILEQDFYDTNDTKGKTIKEHNNWSCYE